MSLLEPTPLLPATPYTRKEVEAYCRKFLMIEEDTILVRRGAPTSLQLPSTDKNLWLYRPAYFMSISREDLYNPNKQTDMHMHVRECAREEYLTIQKLYPSRTHHRFESDSEIKKRLRPLTDAGAALPGLNIAKQAFYNQSDVDRYKRSLRHIIEQPQDFLDTLRIIYPPLKTLILPEIRRAYTDYILELPPMMQILMLETQLEQRVAISGMEGITPYYRRIEYQLENARQLKQIKTGNADVQLTTEEIITNIKALHPTIIADDISGNSLRWGGFYSPAPYDSNAAHVIRSYGNRRETWLHEAGHMLDSLASPHPSQYYSDSSDFLERFTRDMEIIQCKSTEMPPGQHVTSDTELQKIMELRGGFREHLSHYTVSQNREEPAEMVRILLGQSLEGFTAEQKNRIIGGVFPNGWDAYQNDAIPRLEQMAAKLYAQRDVSCPSPEETGLRARLSQLGKNTQRTIL